jgi:prepilin-type processing-associated H-X9-DG protein
MQYTQDYDEKLPMNGVCGGQLLETGLNSSQPLMPTECGGVSYLHLWWHMIYPYVKNTQVFVCPSSGATWNGNYYPTSPKGSYSSYGYNQNLVGPLSLAAIPQVASTPFLADSTYYLTNAYTSCTTTLQLNPSEICTSFGSALNADPPTPLHLDTFNMLFVDGHVKSQRVGDWTTANAKASTDPIWQKWVPSFQN